MFTYLQAPRIRLGNPLVGLMYDHLDQPLSPQACSINLQFGACWEFLFFQVAQLHCETALLLQTSPAGLEISLKETVDTPLKMAQILVAFLARELSTVAADPSCPEACLQACLSPSGCCRHFRDELQLQVHPTPIKLLAVLCYSQAQQGFQHPQEIVVNPRLT